MSFLKVYIKPFKGDLTYEDDFVEVTSDVDLSGIGKITQKLDNNEFNVGSFKFTNLGFTLSNDQGLYSEPGVLRSIFVNKRKDSIVKVTWSQEDDGPICGVAICGSSYLADEKTLFYGLLNDTATTQAISRSELSLSAQGIESIFSTTETNYSSLSVGDNISVTIYNLLNQTRITELLSVSQVNISCGEDQIPDSIALLEETTVKEALDELLEKTNSILYIDVGTQVVYVKPRTPEASVSKTFYGQGSNIGSEDIVDINKISVGNNKMFNFWKWSDSTTTSKDTSSISTYGVRKKEIGSDLLTNGTKIGNILTSYKDEFSIPKQEFDLITIFDYGTIDLFILDRVAIDYPTLYYPAVDSLPRYGITRYGADKYPYASWILTINTSTNYKILGRVINLKNQTITFNLKEI
jgi:hypothetical protein